MKGPNNYIEIEQNHFKKEKDHFFQELQVIWWISSLEDVCVQKN